MTGSQFRVSGPGKLLILQSYSWGPHGMRLATFQEVEVEIPMINERLDGRPADGLNPENWWGAIGGEILEYLRGNGSASMNELCEQLCLSEDAATAFLARLAREGKVKIAQVELADNLRPVLVRRSAGGYGASTARESRSAAIFASS